MSNLNYKLLKPGTKSSPKYGDQVDHQGFGENRWRNTTNNYTVSRLRPTRRPDAKSLEIIRVLQEQLEELDLIKRNIEELIYE